MSSGIEITPELMAGFLDEAPEYLEMLDTGLMEFESKAGAGVLALEAPEDREQMNTMFRAAHSLKGLAAAFGFGKIKDLTHIMETLFDQVRMLKRDLSSDSFEVLFKVFDRLKALVAELSEPQDEPVEIADVLESLNAILNDNAKATSGKQAGQDDTKEGANESVGASQSSSTASQDHEFSADSCTTNEVFSDPELAALFVETTAESIEELNESLLGLEESPSDEDLLNHVFRAAHNIKGASGAAGLMGMNRVTHNMETIFDELRAKRLTLDDEIMTVIFSVVDRIRSVNDMLRQGEVSDINPSEFAEKFAKWFPVGKAVNSATSEASPSDSKEAAEIPSEDEASGVLIDANIEEGHLSVIVNFPAGSDESSIQSYLIFNKLGELGRVVSTTPDLDDVTGDTSLNEVSYLVETDTNPKDIQQVIMAYSVESVTVALGGVEDDIPRNDNSDAITGMARSKEKVADLSGDLAAIPTLDKTDNTKKPTMGQTKQIEVQTPPSAPKTPANSAASKSSTPGKVAGKAEKSAVKTGETLRVDQARLDELMNLGGELVINRARFSQVHSLFREVFEGKNLGFLSEDLNERLARLNTHILHLQTNGSDESHRDLEEVRSDLLILTHSIAPVCSLVQKVHDLRPAMYDFDEALHSLSRVSEGIQKGIMGTRMVSVGPLFGRFRRVVRDICKSTGKRVDLVLRGEHTELDKRMIDELGDPLTHMIRNSVDHGIEIPEDRLAAGKPETGTLILEACHRGNTICIEVTDDGAGVNIDRVGKKAVEKELVTEVQLEKMGHQEIAQFIMQPGFSTAQVVTDLSGRGMGMDIVKAKIDRLSGAVELDTTPGQGTKVTIRLPLTLAILTSLVARIGKGVYALPLETVAEIITVKREDIRRIQRRDVVRVRDRVIPLLTFEKIFHTNAPSLCTESCDADELEVVIIGFEKDNIGLVVDELYGQDDVVIKSISENYTNVRGIAGASIRGDGTVSLILDVSAMLDLAAKVSDEVETEATSLVPMGA